MAGDGRGADAEATVAADANDRLLKLESCNKIVERAMCGDEMGDRAA